MKAKTPAVGIHTNSLDEFNATAEAAADKAVDMALAFDGFSRLVVPAGAVTDPAGVTMTAGLPKHYVDVWPPYILGEFRKVHLSNGQTRLDGAFAEITIGIAYLDQDKDGMVDDTPIYMEELVMYRLDNDSMTWQPLVSRVDPDGNVITAQTNGFSLFALGINPAYPGGSDHHSANDGNWFGCAISNNISQSNAMAGMLPIMACFLAALGLHAIVIVNRKRR